MKPTTLKIISILLEMKEAFRDLLKKNYKGPALLTIYAFIDICASLNAEPTMTSNKEIFETYIGKYINPWNKSYSIYDLWAARSSLIHTLSPIGFHTNKSNGAAVPIFYYSWQEKKETVESIIKSKGHEKFHLLDVNEIKILAIDLFNSFYQEIDLNSTFEEKINNNAVNILDDLHFYRLEEELKLIGEYIKEIETE